MSKTKRAVIIATGIAAALIILAGLALWYSAYHPHIYITRGTGARDDEDFHSEVVAVVIGDGRGLPMADSVREELEELSVWNNEVDAELSQYRGNTPYNIRVSGVTDSGKITLRYEGYVTGQDGERVDYKKEMTFDLPVRRENFIIPALSVTEDVL